MGLILHYGVGIAVPVLALLVALSLRRARRSRAAALLWVSAILLCVLAAAQLAAPLLAMLFVPPPGSAGMRALHIMLAATALCQMLVTLAYFVCLYIVVRRPHPEPWCRPVALCCSVR